MTTQIVTLTNGSQAGAIVLGDDSSGGCVSVGPGGTSNVLLWTIPQYTYQQCILGPGPLGGQGSYDWIYDDGESTIYALRAGPYQPVRLISLSGGGIYYIYITYNSSSGYNVTRYNLPEGATFPLAPPEMLGAG
jgi:hypothetical protein